MPIAVYRAHVPSGWKSPLAEFSDVTIARGWAERHARRIGAQLTVADLDDPDFAPIDVDPERPHPTAGRDADWRQVDLLSDEIAALGEARQHANRLVLALVAAGLTDQAEAVEKIRDALPAGLLDRIDLYLRGGTGVVGDAT